MQRLGLRGGRRMFGWLAGAGIAVAVALTALTVGGILFGGIETTPVSAQTSDDPPTPPAPSGALGNPSDLAAAPGSAAGTVDLTWTPGANADLHLVYLAAADGSGGRYGPRLSGSSDSTTISDLVGGRRYFFIVIAGQASLANPGTYQWSAWSNWATATAPRLGGLPNPPALPSSEEREYSRYAEFEGWVVSVDREAGTFRLRVADADYVSITSLPDVVTVDLSGFRSVPTWLRADRFVEAEGRYFSASQTMRAFEVELEDDDDDDSDDDDDDDDDDEEDDDHDDEDDDDDDDDD